MDPEPTDPNLLLLSVNLSDSEPDEAAAPATTTTSTSTCLATEHQPTRAERTALSEEAFQELKRTYRPKVENGDVCFALSSLYYPPGPGFLSPKFFLIS
jgi:L-aminopeptidase/D-esterase-like protein